MASTLAQILNKENDAEGDDLVNDGVLRPEDDLRDRESDAAGPQKKKHRNEQFSVLVAVLAGEDEAKPISVPSRELPWDDFLVSVCTALNISGVDAIFDESGAQVTAVQNLEKDDRLTVRVLTDVPDGDSNYEGGEKTLLSVHQLLKSSQTALWDKFIHRIDSGELNLKSGEEHAYDELTEQTFEERARWIPLRLTLKERKVLRLVKAALNSSQYTTNVDRTFKSHSRRVRTQIHEICAFVSGIVTALDYEEGRGMVQDRQFGRHERFLQNIFDVARRHKILNPEKMRTNYAKLAYLQQDAASQEVASLLEVTLGSPMRTVRATLVAGGVEAILRDPLIPIATMECPDDKSKSRRQLQRRIDSKRKAIRRLCRKYASSRISSDTLQECLWAINDNSTYLNFHREPIDKMIHLLTHFFSPKEVRDGFSLAIVAGVATGTDESKRTSAVARLTHSHGRQFHFVLQSLMLWREVTNHMFKLWCLAEEDLRSGGYRLVETGQGLHRVQDSPRVMRAMREILHTVQQKCDTWIGSSVVHLGDKNVPNAIFFIDKYTQISRILRPIITAVEHIPRICKRPGIARYVDAAFGGQKNLANTILHDFFRHAFDGGGAQNFFDAGSCIDGRLTSAWNWCSQVHLKPFYSIFKLTGFTGFDGNEFQE